MFLPGASGCRKCAGLLTESHYLISVLLSSLPTLGFDAIGSKLSQ